MPSGDLPTGCWPEASYSYEVYIFAIKDGMVR